MRRITTPLLPALGLLLTVQALTAQTNRLAPLLRARDASLARAVTTRATPLTSNRVQVPVTLTRPPQNYQVVVREGNTWQNATNALRASAAETNLMLEPGRFYILTEKARPKPAATAPKPAVRLTNDVLFSSLLVTTAPPASAGAPPQTFSGQLFLATRQRPIPWDTAKQAYATELVVGFEADRPADARHFLPLPVQLFGQYVDELLPAAVTIEKAGPEGYKEVSVACRKYSTDASITARYATAESPCPLELEQLGLWGTIQLIFPLPVLFAALTGGLMGGLLRWFRETEKSLGKALLFLIEGGAVGVVAVALLVAGLLRGQIPGVEGSGELVVSFALAALAGYAGAHFLDRIRLPGKSNSGAPPTQEGEGNPARAEGKAPPST